MHEFYFVIKISDHSSITIINKDICMYIKNESFSLFVNSF